MEAISRDGRAFKHVSGVFSDQFIVDMIANINLKTIGNIMEIPSGFIDILNKKNFLQLGLKKRQEMDVRRDKENEFKALQDENEDLKARLAEIEKLLGISREGKKPEQGEPGDK